MVRSDDVLELLMPGADAHALRRAREVTQFLRLLCDDARRSHAPAVGLDLQRARGVLDDHGRASLERALADLLRHHLLAVQPIDAFAWAGDPVLDVADAWREVEAARCEFDGLPELPRPGESAESCGSRVLAALESIAVEPEARLWRARWVQATEGARAAEILFRDLVASPRRPRPSVVVQRAAIAAVAECLLERGAVRETRAWLGEHALQLSVDPRLRRLFAWTRLVLEDEAGARTALVGLRPWSSALPQALCELRDARPDWLACLSGRSDALNARAEAKPREIGGRADCGASAFVVLAFRPGRDNELLAFDVAPALAGRRDAWLAEREGASAAEGEREHDLVARAGAVVEHAEPGRDLRGALGGTATRAIALAPILDEEGDAAGWIHVEFEHHLVPARARLAACAQAWRRAVLESRARDRDEAAPPVARAVPRAFGVVFRQLVDDLAIKTVQRRWIAYSVDGDEPVRVADGGEGQGFADLEPGRARALARALATGCRIDFDEPDERLSIHARACSGVVLPLRFEGATRGLLAIESSRRRDFHGVDFEAWSARADGAAVALRTAQFCAWHRETFAFEPWFDPRGADFSRFARRLARAARSRATVSITGPAGAGKLVLARWVHFESSARGGPWIVASAAGDPDWSRLLARAAGGTLVLEDIEDAGPAAQEALLRELDAPEDCDAAHRARIVVTSRVLGEPGATSAVRSDLALRLERLRLRVPPLADRRAEIPGLAQALAERFAEDEDVAAPRFADDALATLWRQPWPGNIRELENLVHEIVLARPGVELTAEDVERIALESGRELVRRIAPRRPRVLDLQAALDATRTGGSRSNKTRAALYLGWDPDTLVARLADAGLADRVVDTAAWSEIAPEATVSETG